MCFLLFIALLFLLGHVHSQNASTEVLPEFHEDNLSSEELLDQFFADKVWGCKANNLFCPNLMEFHELAPVSQCAYEDMGWICRLGTYEALNGSCVSLYKCSRVWDEVEPILCEGCHHKDLPAKGPTVLDCVEKEETCFPYDAERAANVKCEEHKKRHICEPGYHRVFPDNKCVKNEEFSLDTFYAKPGCKDFLLRTCPPNSHGVCTNGIAPGEAYCPYTNATNPPGPNPRFRSMLEEEGNLTHQMGPQPEDGQCGLLCQCNEGFVRASSDLHSECIPKAECEARLRHECLNDHEEFHRCPKRVDIDCPLLLNIDKDCGMHENIWVPTNSSCSVEEVGEKNCWGSARCLCKPGYVRLNGKCVNFIDCSDYQKEHPFKINGRVGTIDGANRLLAANKAKREANKEEINKLINFLIGL